MHKEEAVWLALSAGAAIGAGILARRGAAEAWRRTLNEHPPAHIADRDASWRRLIAWAAISGFCVAFARALGRGAAIRARQQLRGRTPSST